MKECDAGNLVGLFLSPLILQKLGWRGLFYTFGVLGYPLLAIWLAIVPKPKAKQDLSSQSKEGFLRATTPHPNPIRRYALAQAVLSSVSAWYTILQHTRVTVSFVQTLCKFAIQPGPLHAT